MNSTPPLKKTWASFLIAFILISTAQGQVGAPFMPKLVKTDRLTVEYMDFGGAGTPMVIVQGAHNFFDTSSTQAFIRENNATWIDLYEGFTHKHHVMAPLRRGFGRTDAQLQEFSVETEVADLLSWMDALSIEKAIFLGRGPAAKEMIYIAEHHPERVNGLIFIDPVFMIRNYPDTIVDQFIFCSYSQSYSASEYRNYRFTRTPEYFPGILSDTSIRIRVPALLFYHEFYSNTTLVMRRADRMIQRMENDPNINWQEIYHSPELAAYFEALSKDTQRQHYIRDYLRENNLAPRMQAAMRRAFGDQLVVFNETILHSNEKADMRYIFEKVYTPVIQAFLHMIPDNHDELPNTQGKSAETIIALTKNMTQAWEALDPDKYLDFFSTDLDFYVEGNKVDYNTFSAIVKQSMETLAETSFTISDPAVVTQSEDHAVISFFLKETFQDKNQNVEELEGAMTLIWKRIGGRWKITAAHESFKK